jgi:hypothetical protein
MYGSLPFNDFPKTLCVEEMSTPYLFHITHRHTIEAYATHIACNGRFPDVKVTGINKVAI